MCVHVFTSIPYGPWCRMSRLYREEGRGERISCLFGVYTRVVIVHMNFQKMMMIIKAGGKLGANI